MVDRIAERGIARMEQGMPVIDHRGVVLGSVRDESSSSFLLWRNLERDVIWVSKSVIARVEPFKVVLGCGADQC